MRLAAWLVSAPKLLQRRGSLPPVHVPLIAEQDGASPRLDSFKKRCDAGSVPGTMQDHAQLLRDAALRVTRSRVAVLDAVHAYPHADTETVIGAVRADIGTVSHQAVYDVLRALTSAGLLRRIEPQGSVARYETRTGDNHHHVICRSCGTIADVDCAVGDAPCLTASNDQGFVIDEAEVVYWGVCPACTSALID
jgi:Fe2+ or Zn2+ uptake regulation protein